MRGGAEYVALTMIEGFGAASWHTSLVLPHWYYPLLRNSINSMTHPPDVYLFRTNPTRIVPSNWRREPIQRSRETILQIVRNKELRQILAGHDVVVKTEGSPSSFKKPNIPQFFYAQGRPKRQIRQIGFYLAHPHRIPQLLLQSENIERLNFVAVSQFVRNFFHMHWGVECSVIPPPVDVERFLRIRKSRRIARKIVSIGRFSPEKGHVAQIEIMKRLVQQGEEAHLTMIGETGPSSIETLHEIDRLRRLYGLERFVDVKPNLTKSQLMNELSKAHIFLHTGQNDPFPIAPIEAVAAGCTPCVLDSGGVREIIPSELRFTTIEHASELLNRMLKQDGMAQTGLTRIAMRFRPEVFQGKWNDLLSNSIA